MLSRRQAMNHRRYSLASVSLTLYCSVDRWSSKIYFSSRHAGSPKRQ